MISNKDIHENNQDSIDSKDKLNVGLIINPPFVTVTTLKGPDGKPKKIYGGIIYDVWTIIKKMNNWTDRVTEIPLEHNYDKGVDDLAKGKYDMDMIVGNFWKMRYLLAGL